nr:MAG: RNA-dependent RNA polymerase [Lihan tick virus]
MPTTRLHSLKALAQLTDLVSYKSLYVPVRRTININREQFPAPLISAERSYETVTLKIHLDEGGSEAGSSLHKQGDIVVTVDSAHTFIHDFTFAHLSRETDVKFSKHFPQYNDDFDNYTPDVILSEIGDRTVVIEFATCRATGERALEVAYENKIGKYYMACKNRASQKCKIALLCIVVGYDTVVTNMNIPQLDAEELCLRFSTAVDSYSYMSSRSMLPDLREGDVTTNGMSVQNAFKDIRFNWEVTEEKFPPFSQEMYEGWFTPPDEKYIEQMVYNSFQKVNEDLLYEHFYNLDDIGWKSIRMGWRADAECSWYCYRRSTQKTRMMNTIKSTIPIPGVVLRLCRDPGLNPANMLMKDTIMIDGDSTMSRLWRRVAYELNLGTVSRVEEDREYEEKIMRGEASMMEEHTAKAMRKEFHRLKVSLSEDDRVELAKRGVDGKRFKDHPDVKRNREEKKRGFNLFTDITMFDCFLEEPFEDFIGWEACALPDYVEQIIEADVESLHAHGFRSEDETPMIDSIKGFWSSPIMRWAFMVTCIGVELAIASKQHCSKDEFIIKKLRDYDLFMLIKPTNSGGPMFVSFAWHTTDVDRYLTETKVFKKFEMLNRWCFTNFHSFKASKIETLVKAASRINNLYWFWREQYEIIPWRIEAKAPHLVDVAKMLKISVMVMMEDKSRTEEIITNLRYIMLEGFVSEPCMPRPQKMLEKLPTVARTLLQVWLIQRSLNAIKRVAKNPFKTEPRERKVVWNNIFNPFTMTKVEDPLRLVNLFYLGYLKNKDEPGEKNSAPALVRKIIEMEAQHPGRYDYLGYGDPPFGKMKTHEYSISFQKLVCQTGLDVLKARWGESIIDSMHIDILNAFGNLTLDRVSTLKASSAFDESWYTYNPDKSYHRKKVIENFQKFITAEHTHIHHVLKECLETIEKRGCMHIDIFKKNQHGGLREIYVLGAEERVVQLALETIARQICMKFFSETLTNPGNKTKIPETHGARARAAIRDLSSQKIETVGTSDDLKTFNQTQHTTKLAFTLIKFTRPELHPFIIRACSLFMRKRIKLDDDLLQILVTNSEIETTDRVLWTLHEAYRGRITPPPKWAAVGRSYIETETGMMQGILHFLSSLHHTCLQEWYRLFCMGAYGNIFKTKGSGVVVDVMQSSDDSAVLISYPLSDEETNTRCRVAAAQLFLLKKEFGTYLALYPSVKCTTNTLYFVEFNSEFFFHNNHIRPTLKWVISCDQISEQEALVSRQEELSSALTGILEGGGSISLCHLCQFGQSILHYTLLGAGVTFLFEKFLLEARDFKDPSLGFFLMDHPFGAGLAGFKYNLWNQVRGAQLGAVYKVFLTAVKSDTPPEEKERVYRSIETTGCGALASSVTIRHGNRELWKALKERCQVDEDWEKRFDENPEALYRQARTREEVKLKIAEKLHSPGVSASLSKGNSTIKIISSSIYILSRNVITQGSAWMDPDPSVLKQKKPLMRAVLEEKNISLGDYVQVTEEELRSLFPQHDEFCRLKDIMADHHCITGGQSVGMRKTVQTKVVLVQREDFSKVRPEDILTDVWFSFKRSALTKPVLMEMFESLKETIPWIRDTAEETLKASPFLHQHQLRNFISRMDFEGRVVRLVGVPLKAKVETNVATVICRNFFPTWELHMRFDERSKTASQKALSLKHFVALTLSGPLEERAKRDRIRDTLIEFPDLEVVVGGGKTRRNTLALFKDYFVKGRAGVGQFNVSLRTANCGIIGGFTLPQRSRRDDDGRIVYYGTGIWEGSVNGHYVRIKIETIDGKNQLTEVKAYEDNFVRLQLTPFLRQWCRDMGVSNTHRSLNKDGCMVVINFELRTYGTGCPVRLVPSMGYVGDISYDQMEFRIEGHSMHLLQILGWGRSCKILSYHSRTSDITDEGADMLERIATSSNWSWFKQEPSHSWYTLTSLNYDTYKFHKEIMEKGGRLGNIDIQAYREILKQSAHYTLAMRGFTMHDIPPQTITSGRARDFDKQMWKMIKEGGMSKMFETEQARALLEGAEYEEGEDRQRAGPSTSREDEDRRRIAIGLFPMGVNQGRIMESIDVDLFGEPDNPIIPATLFRHPTLSANCVDNIIGTEMTPTEVTAVLERWMVTEGLETRAKELLWLLMRDSSKLVSVPKRDPDFEASYKVSEPQLDPSMIG